MCQKRPIIALEDHKMGFPVVSLDNLCHFHRRVKEFFLNIKIVNCHMFEALLFPDHSGASLLAPLQQLAPGAS